MSNPILIASSDAERLRLAYEVLTGGGYPVVTTCSGVDCLARVREHRFAVLVLESGLLWGGADGVLECLRDEDDRRSVPPVILIDHTTDTRGLLDAVANVTGTGAGAALVAT